MHSDGSRAPSGTEAIPPAASAYGAEPETAHHEVHLPPPSVWPVTAAAGITVAGAGLVTSPFVGAAGILITIWAIASWIQELRHERHQSH